jgi:hypothetical protein
MDINEDWKRAEAHVFWGEIAPCDHVVQIYENDIQFLDLLTEFVADGIRSDDCTIIIATSLHLKELKSKLNSAGFDIDHLTSSRQLIALDAEKTLEKFMLNGWPDEGRFNRVVGNLLEDARAQKRQVRAFGEMVAILWAKGHTGATVQLEILWNKFMHLQTFTLFCAYPKSGFTENAFDSMLHICQTHTKVISSGSRSEVLYKNPVQMKTG